MKLKDVAILMDEKKANNSELPGGCWTAEDAAPYGLIKTKEQFDYVKLYWEVWESRVLNGGDGV